MERAERQSAAAGQAEHEGTCRSAAEMHRAGVERELRRRLGGKVGELKLLDRTVAIQREADRIPRAGALSQRGVEHALPRELVEEILRHLERTAVRADVLAEHDRLRPLG